MFRVDYMPKHNHEMYKIIIGKAYIREIGINFKFSMTVQTIL